MRGETIFVAKIFLATALFFSLNQETIFAQKVLSPESIGAIQKQAEQSDLKSEYILGLLYYNGDRGLDNDFKKAYYWFEKAAEKGDKGAQYHLGEIYANGRGVTTNKEEAANWYTKAATNGEDLAQYSLGYMYLKGEGVKKDEKMALMWFKRAAYQELPDAQGMCSYFYVNGVGVPQDYVEAYAWLNLSVANNSSSEGGRALREETMSLMTKEQIAEGQKRSTALQKEIDDVKQKQRAKMDLEIQKLLHQNSSGSSTN
jgi:TPR repeat protein